MSIANNIRLINADNMTVDFEPGSAQIIYGDCIYESDNFNWVDKYWNYLKPGGVFIIQTDWHSVFELGAHLKSMPNSKMVNHVVWKCEWGNHPKDRFHQSFDDVIICSKGKHSKFYSDRVQIAKATVNTKLNPSGRQTKTSTAFIADICLTTTSNERVKKDDGHLVRWQKPIALMDRLMFPFSDEGDLIIDVFAGSGTLGEWCQKNNRHYVGIELDQEVYKLALRRLNLDNANIR